MNQKDIESRDEKETGRVEAFSDGVFAIAITLLILDVRVPRDLPETITLRDALLKQWPSYLAFLTSFALIGIMWINHHKLFTLIKRSDHLLLVFNTLLLLGATIVPFTTSLLAEYIGRSEQRVAAMIYMGNFFVIAIFFNLLWRYAAQGQRLLAYNVSEDEVRSINRAYTLGPPVYLLCFAIAYFSVPLALGMTIALVIFYALPLGSNAR
jgi:TMEM175 potassium channel family protein